MRSAGHYCFGLAGVNEKMLRGKCPQRFARLRFTYPNLHIANLVRHRSASLTRHGFP
jgi:hypothetical protein